MPERPIGSVIETSVKFSFSGRNSEPQAVAARNKLEGDTRGVKEKLLGLGKSAAKVLAREGVMPDVTNEVGRRAAEGIWKTAEDRVKQHLKDEASRGNTGWVLATLNEIDRCDVSVQNLSAKPGGLQERKVRRSVGLLPGTKAHFHEASASGKFPDNPEDYNSIILGGQSFRKETVEKALRGEGKYQPMWRPDDVLIPLLSSQTGELHFVTVAADQLPSLSTRLGERKQNGNEAAPKNVQVEFGGESDKGIVRKDSPDEDSYFSGGKGQQHQLRLAGASANIAGYNEANKAGQVTPDQKQKLLMSQDQLRLANESADKIFAGGVDGLFIVADGVGGGEAGELASQKAIQQTLGELAKTSGWAQLSPDQVQQKIKEAVVTANKALFQTRQNLKKDLGSTMTMAMVVGGKIYTANVGDSRVYLYEESTNNVTRLTKDHSAVEALVGGGQITDDERYTHPHRNEIYRCLGERGTVDVDVSGPIDIIGKVKILAACDGAWEMVRDPQLKDLLSQKKSEKEIAKDIISAANANGGEDNITAVVASLSVS